jgi:hypothetical protein
MALRFVQLRRALLRARAGEQQFRLLAEHGRDAAFLLDATTLTYLHQPRRAALPGDPAALRAHAARWRRAGPAAALARRRCQPRPAARSGTAACRRHALALEIHSTLVPAAAGRGVTVAGTVRDVSAAQAQERREGAEALRFHAVA